MGAYNDDVLFIHIPKCGGTAVKEYMVAHLRDVKWPIPEDERTIAESKLPIGHIPLRDIPAFTGRPLESWDKIITTIRDPYAQQMSQWWFWHRRYAEGDEHPHSVHAAMHPRIHTWLLDPDCDFHLWYEHRFKPDSHIVRKPPSAVTGYADWGGYYWYWLSVDDAIPENLTIIKQEEMGRQIPLALAPYHDGPPGELAQVNVGTPINMVQAYSAGGIETGNRSMDIIASKFRWCITEGYYQRQSLFKQ